MKKLILMMAFVTGFGALANAQTHEHKTPQQRAEMMTKRLEKNLSLSNDQSAKVHTILLTQATRVDSLKATKPAGDKKLDRSAFKSIRQTADAQLSAVLNADQLKKYNDWKAAHKGKMHGKKDGADNKQG